MLRLAPVTAGDRVQDATDLVTRLPATLARLADGSITMLHARSLVDAVSCLDDTTTTKIEARVLAHAGQQTVASSGVSSSGLCWRATRAARMRSTLMR